MGAHRVHAMQNRALKHTREMQSGLVFALQEALKSTTVSKRQWRQFFFFSVNKI